MSSRAENLKLASLLFLIVIFLVVGWSLLSRAKEDGNRLHALASHPPLLSSEIQKVRVNFRVYLKPGPGIKPDTIQLRQVDGKTHELNDVGKLGDFFAKDDYYGAVVELDISDLKDGDCLSFIAVFTGDETSLESKPYPLCVSGLPTRVAASDLRNPNRLQLEANSVAVANELLLRFVEGVSERDIEAIVKELNAAIVGHIPAHRFYQVKLPRFQSGDELMAQVKVIREHNSIEAVSPNLVVFNSLGQPTDDSYATDQHGLQKIVSDPVSGKTLWDIPGTTAGRTVVVLDSGVSSLHEELAGMNLHCASISPGGPFTVHNCSAADADSATSSNGHGTRIIGVITAEQNNSISTGTDNIAGIISASPIISVRSTNAGNQQDNADGLDTIAGLIENMEDATYLPASRPIVVNLSRNVGGGPTLPGVQALCTAANNLVNPGDPAERSVILVNSAGNNNDDVDIDPVVWAWPLQCKILSTSSATSISASPNVASNNFDNDNNKFLITVGNSVSCVSGLATCLEGAVDTRYSAVGGSNFGSLVDVFAPGTNVLTPISSSTTGYSNVTGSSLSAPLVAGAVAILLDCGVQAADVSSSLKAGSLVSLDYNGDPPHIPAGTSPIINIFTSLKEFYSSTAHGYGPLVPTFNYAMASSELSAGTVAGMPVANLGLVNSLGTCNEVIYSVPDTDPNFIVDVDELKVKDGASLVRGTMLTATVTAEDAFGRSGTVDIDFTVGPSPDDVYVVLVLDRSGSMSLQSASPEIEKIRAMQLAAQQFVTTIAADERHKLGLVQFHSVVEPLTPPDDFSFQMLDTLNQADAIDAIESTDAGGATNIIEAVAAGASMVNESTTVPRKVVVLFTDGKHNTPSPMSPSALTSALNSVIDNVNSDIDFYSIGFGTSIEDEALGNVAGARDGYHVNEQDLDPIAAGKDFTDVAADVIDDVAIFDPIFNLRAGKSEILNVPVSLNDRSLTIMIRWETANPDQIKTLIKPPLGGCDITRSTSGGAYQFFADHYYLVRVELPFRCRGRLAHSGIWKVILAGAKTLEKEETVNVTTYASSDVKLESKLAIRGDRIVLSAILPDLKGLNFKRANFSAGVKIPIPDTEDSTKLDKSGSEGVDFEPNPPTGFRGLVPIEMKVDSKQSNIARGSFDKLSQIGLYQFHLTVEGLDQNGQKFRREARNSIYYRGAWYTRWMWTVAIIGVLVLVLAGLVYRNQIRSSFS